MSRIRVLLVEDQQSDAALIEAHLRSDGRFSVRCVETLADALSVLRVGRSADAVIVDLNLPDSTGLATFETLHRHCATMPYIILSGGDDEQLAIDAVAHGAQDYVSKASLDGKLLARSVLYSIERAGREVAERRNVWMEHDLAVARQIQLHLLPSRAPEIHGFEIATSCQPAEVCCGDFFDFVTIATGDQPVPWIGQEGPPAVDVVVADVSSHGFGPAMIMVGTRRVLRTCAPIYHDIRQLLTIANRAVAEDTLAEHFVTAFYARINPENRTMTYIAAGQPAWVLRADGEVLNIDSTSLPLGVMHDTVYQNADSITLQDGDMILLLTDGAYETQSPAGEQYGVDRLVKFVQARAANSAAVIVDELSADILAFCSPNIPDDDVTVAVIKVGPS